MTNENVLVPWLDDAYAMENALLPIFETHAALSADQPVLQARLQEHVERTRQHGEAIKGCIERLAHRPSRLKVSAATLMGTIQTMSAAVLGDVVLRNFLADYAAQRYQIAFYKAVMAAAADLGDTQTLQTCQGILREEEEMVDWIERQIPEVVRESLRQKSASLQ
jgi:ferritin-like metal-binding protein YciE